MQKLRHTARIAVVMGVSGSGKTTIGKALARKLGWRFIEGDDFHPPENVAKMAAGIPLEDADRQPWLERIHDELLRMEKKGESAVVACSALKHAYRKRLRAGLKDLRFVSSHEVTGRGRTTDDGTPSCSERSTSPSVL